jgi:hypothetical protein
MPILPYLVTPWGEGDLSWHGKQLHQATATSTGIFGLPPLRIATDNAHGRNVGPWNAQSMVGGFGWTDSHLSDVRRLNRAGQPFTICSAGWTSRLNRSKQTVFVTFGHDSRRLRIVLGETSLRHCEGARGIKSRWALSSCTADGSDGSTPKHLIQSTDGSERARYCTQYIARSLSARSAGSDSGVGGDRPVCWASINLEVLS